MPRWQSVVLARRGAEMAVGKVRRATQQVHILITTSKNLLNLCRPFYACGTMQTSPVSGNPDTHSIKAGSTEGNVTANTAAVTKRLQQELTTLMFGGESGVSAFPSGDSLFTWVGTIAVSGTDKIILANLSIPTMNVYNHKILQGPNGTAYEGLTFRLVLSFTSEYPFKAPVVRFDTPCFHPNVDVHGNICLDILKEKWSGEQKINHGLFSHFLRILAQIRLLCLYYVLQRHIACVPSYNRFNRCLAMQTVTPR